MIYAVWFDVEDSGNRDTMEYFKIDLLNSFWKPPINGNYTFSGSAYCGALFLGIF